MFSRFDDHAIFRAAESTDGAAFSGQGALLESTAAVRVEYADSPLALVAFVGSESNLKLKLLYSDRIRSFVDATYACCGEEGILDAIDRGTLKYQAGYLHPDNPDWVVVRFRSTFDGHVSGTMGQGTTAVIFDTANGWVISQCEDFREAPTKFAIRSQVETIASGDLGHVPAHVVVEHFYDLSPDSQPGNLTNVKLFRRTNALVSDVERIDQFSDAEFSLVALGIKDFNPNRGMFVILAGNVVLLLAVVTYFIMRRRFRSAV